MNMKLPANNPPGPPTDINTDEHKGELNSHSAERREKGSLLNALAWLSVPILLLLVIIFLYTLNSSDSYPYPRLRFLLGLVFTTFGGVLIAFLAGRSFLYQSMPSLLMLGCGALILGSGSLVGTTIDPYDINGQIAVYNICVWLSAFCHLAGAIIRQKQTKAMGSAAGVWLGFAYLLSLFLVWTTRVAVTENLAPPFFIQGQGGTPLRQFVLISAIGMFILSAVLLKQPRSKSTGFNDWYAMALLLIAVGLLGVLLQHSQASLIGWTGRSAQYLGGLCMLIAAAVSVRDSRGLRLSIETALHETKQQFDSLVDLAADGILIHELASENPRNCIIKANPALCDLLGYKLGEMRSMTLMEITAPENRVAVLEKMETITHEKALRHEEALIAKDGRRVPVEISSRLFLKNRRPLIMSIVRDFTERKLAEDALRQLNESLENTVIERTANLVAANQELEARAKQLRLLAGELTMVEKRERKRLAQILHDGLQQYLVAAKLQVGGLVDQAPDAAVKQVANEVEILLGESIRVSRSLASELSPPILNEAGLLAGLEWLSRWMSDKHGLKVELVMQMDAPHLTEDVKVLLFESVRELLLNVVKHAKTHSARVQLRLEDGRLHITVSDDGKGFDPAGAIVNGGGFGLLSIRERSSLIGGGFEVDSSPGKGARFTLTAPLAIIEPLESMPGAQPKRVDGADATSLSKPGGKIRILLVDDHAVMREGLSRLLEYEPEFEVIDQANDGQEAVEKAGALHPDVILMDISMPRMNGIDATRMIRELHPDIRIIGLSLYSEEERAREMLGAGAIFYMTKSGPPSDLKAAIRACMNETLQARMEDHSALV